MNFSKVQILFFTTLIYSSLTFSADSVTEDSMYFPEKWLGNLDSTFTCELTRDWRNPYMNCHFPSNEDFKMIKEDFFIKGAMTLEYLEKINSEIFEATKKNFLLEAETYQQEIGQSNNYSNFLAELANKDHFKNIFDYSIEEMRNLYSSESHYLSELDSIQKQIENGASEQTIASYIFKWSSDYDSKNFEATRKLYNIHRAISKYAKREGAIDMYEVDFSKNLKKIDCGTFLEFFRFFQIGTPDKSDVKTVLNIFTPHDKDILKKLIGNLNPWTVQCHYVSKKDFDSGKFYSIDPNNNIIHLPFWGKKCRFWSCEGDTSTYWNGVGREVLLQDFRKIL